MMLLIEVENFSSLFPIRLDDLSILIAITAITLLIMSEVLYPYFGFKLLINTKRLRRVAMLFSIFFLALVTIKIIEVISPLY
jgi:hypothetical protein